MTSADEVLKTPLPGGGERNAACASFTPRADTSNLRDPDDAQSVGSVITFGEFRAIDLADLWWTKELELICPNNPIGTVDVYFAGGHGSDAAGSLPLVHGLRPRVAVMQNGTRKGGAADAMRTMRASPGLEDVWQMHWSHNVGIELNSAGVYIANIEDPGTIAGILTAPPGTAGRGRGQGTTPAATGAPTSTAAGMPSAAHAAGGPPPAGAPAAARAPAATGHDPAFWLEVSAQPDGTFTITNSRNGFSKTYTRRSPSRNQ